MEFQQGKMSIYSWHKNNNVIVTILSKSQYFRIQIKNLTEETLKVPVVKSSHLLGNLKPYVGDPYGFLAQKHTDYGEIFKFRLAYRYLHVTADPNHIHEILQEYHRSFIKSLAYRKLTSLLGNGLFTNEGQSWLKNRRLAQPSFHKKMIAQYFEGIKSYGSSMCQEWKSKKEVTLLSEMSQVTLNIICKTLLGIDIGHGGDIVEKHLPYALDYMIKRVTSSINAPMWWPSEKNKKYHKSVAAMNDLIEKIIQEKKNSGEHADLLSQLMLAVDKETNHKFTEEQLRDEVITFFLAGHETSAVSMAWTIYLLETNPAIKQKFLTEVNNIGEVTLESVQQAPYVEAVIKESMRIYSPIWVIGRESIQDVTLSGGYHLKKGSSIIFSPLYIHRSPKYWENPDVFRPERFLNGAKIKEGSYFPFGGGPRLCIGNNFAMLEMKTLLIMMYQQLNINMQDKTHPDYQYSLTLRPKNEIRLQVS